MGIIEVRCKLENRYSSFCHKDLGDLDKHKADGKLFS